MARLPTLIPRDSKEEAVLAAWRDGGLRSSTMAMYLRWVRRWRKYWERRGIDEIPQLTLAAVTKVLSRVVGSQRRHSRNWANARKSIHAWACGLRTLGFGVPPWHAPRRPHPLSAVLSAYAEYRRAHHGVTAITIRRDVAIGANFLSTVRSRGRSIATAQTMDIDALVDRWLARVSRSPMARVQSHVRGVQVFGGIGAVNRDGSRSRRVAVSGQQATDQIQYEIQHWLLSR
jgi:hypothetical protein